tara:strand:+ start:389 stop:574 length:186 start_codon:yes stop_codon:yes gene_type:complete
MVVNQRLRVIHDMWIKNIIEPSHIISYLNKLDYTLGSITLSEINITSKDKKTKYTWKHNTK